MIFSQCTSLYLLLVFFLNLKCFLYFLPQMELKKKKEDFINFLMSRKHGLPEQQEPIGLNFINLLDTENKLDCLIQLYDEQNGLQLSDILISLENTTLDLSQILSDLLFAILNSKTVKLLKDKEEIKKFPSVLKIYKNAFDENKKYLKDFNTKDKKIKETKEELNPIVTRFAPEPSGYLHIGHAKAALVNVALAEKSNGRLVLRFDDTNPDKKYELFENQIVKDLKELKIENYTVSHSSDYFEIIIEKAKFLIEENKAYCDNTEQEKMREERMEGIESQNRNKSIKENLEIFGRMLKGEAEGFCLRAKIDMKDTNKAMRDPVIFRSTTGKHYRVGDKLHAFPTYDFSCPIIDSLEGITLACRANEYRDRNAQYNWFIKNLQLENKPKIFDFSRLNFENAVLSKRKINELIEKGYVSGWDDPRLATIQGIKRAGMDMGALKEYIMLQGASHKTSVISWDKIWAINKKTIDNLSPRFMCIPLKDIVTVTVLGLDGPIYSEVHPLHKKNPQLGNKDVIYFSSLFISQEDAQIIQEGEEITLMNWGNAIVNRKVGTEIIKEINLSLHLEGDFKKTKNKISWISTVGSVRIKTFEYGNIFNDSGDFNEDSVKEIDYLAESAIVKHCEVGKHVQFERMGFYYCDKPFTFNLIPFTKQKRTFK